MDFKNFKTFSLYQPVLAISSRKGTWSKAHDMIEDQVVMRNSGMVQEKTIFAVRAEHARTNYYSILRAS